MTQARTVVYVAADAETAREGSTRLEDADSALEAEPVVGLEELRDRAPVVDCVVFAETPTTAEGANLLEVIDAARETPVVLFTDPEYGARTARSTEGVDGYVRRGSDGAVAHLADEIAWVCHDDGDTEALPGATDGSDDVLAGLPEGILVVDREGRITYANEWLGDFLGVDASGLRGVTIETLGGTGTLPPSDAEAIEGAIDAVLAGDESVSEFPVEITTEDGVRAVSLRVAADGDVATVTARPIDGAESRSSRDSSSGTERSAATSLRELASDAAAVAAADGIDDAAERAVEAVRTVVEPDGAALLLADGPTTEGRDTKQSDTRQSDTEGADTRQSDTEESDAEQTDAAGLDAAGTETGELAPVAREGTMAEPWTDVEPVEDGAVDEAFRTGEVVVREGEETTFERFDTVVAVPVGDRGVLEVVSSDTEGVAEDGRLALEVLAVVLRETIARLRTRSALEGALERLETVFETLPDPAVRYEIVAGRTVVSEINPAFADAYGFDREAVRGRPLEEVVAPPSGETRDPIDLLTREGSDRVRTRRRIDGETRDVRLTVVPLESDGRIVEGVAIYTDVTEQVRRERELEARSDRLDEFATIVGQDLRSPLNVARGYLELAEATGDAEHFEEIESAHERIDALIGQLLTLFRVDDVDAESATEPVSLHGVARDAWGDVDTGSAGLELEADARFRAVRELVTELLANLVTNCVEHGADDGNRITVRIGATDRGFYVADDGAGIAPEDRDAVLESGYTTDEERTGYGLTVVDRIATAHGWTVAVGESDTGGARVMVDGVALEGEADGGGDPDRTDADREEPNGTDGEGEEPNGTDAADEGTDETDTPLEEANGGDADGDAAADDAESGSSVDA